MVWKDWQRNLCDCSFRLAAVVAPSSTCLMYSVLASVAVAWALWSQQHPAPYLGRYRFPGTRRRISRSWAFKSKSWGLLNLSSIFFIESVSVIAQVATQATKDHNGIGKRWFKMSPFHKHLELSGWAEQKSVAVFYLVNAALALVCLASKLLAKETKIQNP